MKYMIIIAAMLPTFAFADEARPPVDMNAPVTLTVGEIASIVEASVAQSRAQDAAQRSQAAMAKYRAQTETKPSEPKAKP